MTRYYIILRMPSGSIFGRITSNLDIVRKYLALPLQIDVQVKFTNSKAARKD